MTEAQGWTAERDALLTEVRALQAIIDHDRGANENCQKVMATLEAEVERLRADAELGRLVRIVLPAQHITEEFRAVGLLYIPTIAGWVVALCSDEDIEGGIEQGGAPEPEMALKKIAYATSEFSKEGDDD